MSLSLAHFIQDVGIDKDGNMRMVTLKYEENIADPQNPQTIIVHSKLHRSILLSEILSFSLPKR